MSARVVVAIQCRLGSTRLPRKVLLPMGGLPMIQWIANRVEQSGYTPEIVFTTGADQSDDGIEAFCHDAGYRCFRAPVDDIVTRLYQCLEGAQAEYLVRIWGDCPFICADILDQALSDMIEKGWQFAGTDRIGPRSLPYGLDFEVYSRFSLEGAHLGITEMSDREFPVEYVLRTTDPERLGMIHGAPARSDLTLSVDYPADYEAACTLADVLRENNSPPVYAALLDAIASRPELPAKFAQAPRNVEYKSFLSRAGQP